MIRLFFLAELLVSLLAGAAFLVLFLRRQPLRVDAVMFWHIAAFSGATVLADVVLTLLALGVPVPPWVLLVAYGMQAAVVVQRLWLLLFSRGPRHPRRMG